MIEHRRIERMIAVLADESERISEEGNVDPVLIERAVDFIRTYADRTHHGKEEDILFRDLKDKDLSDEDQALMDELVQEHIYARELTGSLSEANERYQTGEDEAVETVLAQLDNITDLYPEHIRKEDKEFFPASMAYFAEEEQDAMLEEMWEFDREMIHEKYESVVAAYEEDEG
jgi:hemerythrin-like domain-containing protein